MVMTQKIFVTMKNLIDPTIAAEYGIEIMPHPIIELRIEKVQPKKPK